MTATTASLYLIQAKSRIGLGQYAAAEAALLAAAAANTASVEPFVVLGDLRTSRRQYPAALAAYEEALQRAPENDLLMNNIACLSADHGFDLTRAAALAARMWAQHPQDPAVADTLGWVLFRQGKVTEALPLLMRAVAGAPNNPLHRYHYGMALRQAGQSAASRTELAAALKLSRNFNGAEQAADLLARR